MKLRNTLQLVFCIYGLFVPQLIRGQGLVYLSNTNQTIINEGNWTAGMIQIPFTTGANTPGYLLNSVTVLFANNNIPVLTTADISDYSIFYTYFQSGVEVGSAGYYTLTPDTPLSLAANTPYLMMVFTADPFVSVNWNYITSSAVTSVDNWSASLSDGAEIPLFAISATPIAPAPEPTVVSFVCLGAFVSILFRKRRHFSNRTPPNSKIGGTT
jgi:hypothetical protein